MKKPTICRYCGGVIRLVPATSVYGSSANRLGMTHEFLYQCQNCNARVGCHIGSLVSLDCHRMNEEMWFLWMPTA